METLLISKYMIMKSAAGYYIGRYCYEHTGGDPQDITSWCLQPYDRNTGYMHKEDAERYLGDYKQDSETPVETEDEFQARFTLHVRRTP